MDKNIIFHTVDVRIKCINISEVHRVCHTHSKYQICYCCYNTIINITVLMIALFLIVLIIASSPLVQCWDGKSSRLKGHMRGGIKKDESRRLNF